MRTMRVVASVILLTTTLTACSQCAGKFARIGMTKAELVAACGKPWYVNFDEDIARPTEQWVYGPGMDYVYVEHGVVTSMQYTGDAGVNGF